MSRLLLQNGLLVNGQPYVGTSDTYIDAAYPLIPRYPAWDLRIKGGESRSVLIRFDLGALPPNANVRAAELVFYVDTNEVIRPLEAAAYRVLRSWDVTKATWSNRAQDLRWAIAGCNGVDVDRVNTADDEITLEYRGVFRGFDVTQSVRHWALHSEENFGWLIKGVGESNGGFNFYASRRPAEQREFRPLLRIDYDEIVVTPTATATPHLTASPTPTPSATATATSTPEGGSVAALVFEDVNRNQLYDQGEPRLAGVTLELLNMAREVLQRGVTTQDGTCIFAHLMPGDYRVREYTPWGYVSSTEDEVRVAVASTQVWVTFGDYPGGVLALPLIYRLS